MSVFNPAEILNVDCYAVLAIAIWSDRPLTVEQAFDKYYFNGAKNYERNKGAEALAMYDAGIPYKEIAEALCTNPNTISSLISHARERRTRRHDMGTSI